MTTTSYPMFACRSPNAGLALSPGFHIFFRTWAKKINCPGCRRADGDVNIWTVPLLNRLGIPLTPLFQVGTGKAVALRPPETGVEARGPSNSPPTVPGLRLTALLFFSSGSGVFRYARKRRDESRLCPCIDGVRSYNFLMAALNRMAAATGRSTALQAGQDFPYPRLPKWRRLNEPRKRSHGLCRRRR